MSSEDTEHKELFKRNLSHSSLVALAEAEEELQDGFTYEDHHELQPMSPVSPKRLTGDIIRFHRVALDAPDGMPLVRGLNERHRMTVAHAHCLPFSPLLGSFG